jgi:hypothetical protein
MTYAVLYAGIVPFDDHGHPGGDFTPASEFLAESEQYA